MYSNLKPGEPCTCPKCNGSGLYYTKTAVPGVLNAGPCYSCRGTGVHTYEDSKRCETYWNKYARLG